MKTCPDCKKEVSKGAKVCPNCGKKLKKPIALFIILGIIILSILASVVSEDDPNKTSSTTGNTKKTEKFTLEDGHTGYPDEANMFYYIEGVVRNNTDKKYSYVQATFNVYDENNNNLGSCIANNNNLEAKSTWKFKAVCQGDASSIKSYKLDEITGY